MGIFVCLVAPKLGKEGFSSLSYFEPLLSWRGSTGLTLRLAEEFILFSADYADTTLCLKFEHDYEVVSRTGIQYVSGYNVMENGVAFFFYAGLYHVYIERGVSLVTDFSIVQGFFFFFFLLGVSMGLNIATDRRLVSESGTRLTIRRRDVQ